ncbi:hypothetical protein MTsPCn9_29860 [Croceitalea sp. MTPC9]|uniref:hypothetical protein n=1 Tax=unclassified Croceitalea TaxID=2632280 RepID=UPI002B3DD2BC|nr:hypothetical protein MTsPCn6_21800 [Croceitalea sp. MTPC6]GMN18046.1 hypothetical protein MTsPCn9_29860 [Croceitalea sp. MTPC9]
MIRPNDWKTIPIPSENESFYSGRLLMPEEYSKLYIRLKPESMDDKWFAYCQGKSIYFHRSWLGHCIFIARVEKKGDEIFLGEVTVNKNPEQFGAQDIEVKRGMFEKLVDLVLQK